MVASPEVAIGRGTPSNSVGSEAAGGMAGWSLLVPESSEAGVDSAGLAMEAGVEHRAARSRLIRMAKGRLSMFSRH